MFQHFTLIWAATLMLQCMCSLRVELQCPKEGAPPAINCTINTTCIGLDYMWMDSNNNSICNSSDSNYKCKWNNKTFVSLLLTKGAKCETYKVFIETTCGFNHSVIPLTHCDNGELFFWFCFCLHICERIITEYNHCFVQGPPSNTPRTNGQPGFPVMKVSAVIFVLLLVYPCFVHPV